MSKEQELYLPFLDALRAIAVLAVIIFHFNSSLLPGGFVGVDIFFVISGFIVSASVSSHQAMPLHRFVIWFYARRFRRILPALLVCLVITALLSVVFIPHAWLSVGVQKTSEFAFYGLSNYQLIKFKNDYFSPSAEFNPFTHTWSLGVEEQFYLVFPIIFCSWMYGGRWRLLSTLMLIVATLASAYHSLALQESNKASAYYLATSRFWQLGLGVALFQWMAHSGKFKVDRIEWDKVSAGGALVSLFLVMIGICGLHPKNTPMPGALGVVAGTLGCIYFLFRRPAEGRLMRLLVSAPMLFVGKRSYSLYLWHWPILVLFRWTVGLDLLWCKITAVFLGCLAALASYSLVEQPVRRAKLLRDIPRYAVVVPGIILCLLGGRLPSLLEAKRAVLSISPPSRNQRDWYPHGDATHRNFRGCVATTRLEGGVENPLLFKKTFMREGCKPPLPPLPEAPQIFVLGDSHALGYMEMLSLYALFTGAKVTTYSIGGCPVLGLMPGREDWPICKSSLKSALEEMRLNHRPGDVVLLASLRLVRFFDQWADGALVGEVAQPKKQSNERLKLVREGELLLRTLTEQGFRVILEAPKPIFRSAPFRCASWYNRFNRACDGGFAVSRGEIESLRKPVLDVFNDYATRIPGVEVWDPMPLLCGARHCSAFLKKRPLFFDGDHLSGFGNRRLLSSFGTLALRSPFPPGGQRLFQ